ATARTELAVAADPALDADVKAGKVTPKAAHRQVRKRQREEQKRKAKAKPEEQKPEAKPAATTEATPTTTTTKPPSRRERERADKRLREVLSQSVRSIHDHCTVLDQATTQHGSQHLVAWEDTIAQSIDLLQRVWVVLPPVKQDTLDRVKFMVEKWTA